MEELKCDDSLRCWSSAPDGRCLNRRPGDSTSFKEIGRKEGRKGREGRKEGNTDVEKACCQDIEDVEEIANGLSPNVQ